MPKHLAQVWLLCALTIALALPTQTLAASSFSYTIERNTCVPGAGKYGFGHGLLRVRIIEYGRSGANRFTFVAQVWHRGLHLTDWTKEFSWNTNETTFPNDRASYWNSRSFTYDPKHDAYHRIVATVRVWHNSERLFSKTVFGAIC